MTEKKLTPSERRAIKRKEQIEKGQAIAGIAKGSNEPVVTQENYSIELLKALNYYNVAYDDKDKRKWAIAYVGKSKAKDYDNASDHEFKQLGALIRLKQRDQYLAEKELSYIEDTLKKLSAIQPPVVDDTKQSKPAGPSIQDRMLSSARVHAAEFDAMIDQFIIDGTVPDFASYLKANNISPQVAKLIPTFYNRLAEELVAVHNKTDEQLVEGYSHLSATKLKKLMNIVMAIMNECTQRTVAAKAERKPRARKEKPPAVLAAKVKYMTEFAELGLKSEHPSKIVNASAAVVYNTKYKKLMVYEADENGKLSIKGTSIIGYSVANSGSKTLRKPEITKDISTMNKSTIRQTFKKLTTKEAAVNGRVNEDCIILKVL